MSNGIRDQWTNSNDSTTSDTINMQVLEDAINNLNIPTPDREMRISTGPEGLRTLSGYIDMRINTTQAETIERRFQQEYVTQPLEAYGDLTFNGAITGINTSGNVILNDGSIFNHTTERFNIPNEFAWTEDLSTVFHFTFVITDFPENIEKAIKDKWQNVNIENTLFTFDKSYSLDVWLLQNNYIKLV